MVDSPTLAGHTEPVARAQEDRQRRHVSTGAADEKDGRVTEAVNRGESAREALGGGSGRRTHENETSGLTASTSAWSTCEVKLSLSWYCRCACRQLDSWLRAKRGERERDAQS